MRAVVQVGAARVVHLERGDGRKPRRVGLGRGAGPLPGDQAGVSHERPVGRLLISGHRRGRGSPGPLTRLIRSRPGARGQDHRDSSRQRDPPQTPQTVHLGPPGDRTAAPGMPVFGHSQTAARSPPCHQIMPLPQHHPPRGRGPGPPGGHVLPAARAPATGIPLPAYGIGNHPEALLVLGGKPPDAERLHRSLRGPDVVCPNVEV